MRILLFLFFLFVIAALFPILQDKEISKQKKAFYIGSFLVLLLLAYTYTKDMANDSKEIDHTLAAYKSGKILQCNDANVDNKTYRYTSGTLSFSPIDAHSLTYALEDCTIK